MQKTQVQTAVELIEILTTARGWNSKELAEHADVSTGCVANTFSGRTLPHRSTLFVLGRAVGLDISYEGEQLTIRENDNGKADSNGRSE